jgi:transcriptional regulator with XRE-family HTH domain
MRRELNKMTKGEKIKELRILNKLSQLDVAKRLNVTIQTIHKYEQNIITNIPSDKIEMMAEMFNVNPAYIYGWEENKVQL